MLLQKLALPHRRGKRIATLDRDTERVVFSITLALLCIPQAGNLLAVCVRHVVEQAQCSLAGLIGEL